MITSSRSSKNLGGFDDYYGMLSKKKVPRFGQTQIGHHEEPFDPKKENQDNQMDFDIDDGYFHHEDNEHDQRIAELSENKRYVPVALCLETETEYHDSFRHIMLSLFDLIRIPENLVNKIHDNRTMAFAELIAHLAFLRTIPAPPFNSIYNIYCFN